MTESIDRDVFKIEDQDNTIRFGAKFLEVDGLEEKWSGEIPEEWGLKKDQVIGRIITNSEGKEYKINKITHKNTEGKSNYQKIFWIEKI